MPKIETRTIHTCKNGKQVRALPHKRASKAQERKAFDTYQRREARKARQERIRTTRSDGVTRCSRCPPTTCCADCAAVNKARIYAGLIRPKDDPRPHPNNCYQPCIPSARMKARRPQRLKDIPYPVVTACVRQLGGGWRVGVAMLDGKDIYVSDPMRSTEQAMAWALQSKDCIKAGLELEAMLAD